MMRIRFRTDSDSQADDAARLARGQETLWYDPPDLDGVVPAAPGDCWRVHWHSSEGKDRQGPIAGYAICCPLCRQVHRWTSARNCASKNDEGRCAHTGVGSCWAWTGSPEEGTLTASPSLHAIDEGGADGSNAHGCGWHGWLRSGEMVAA